MYSILFNILSFFSPLQKKISIFLRRFKKYMPKLRGFIYQYKFKSIGKKCSLGSKITITVLDNNIQLSNNVAIRNNVIIGGRGELTIGRNTVINEQSIIACYEKVEIGEDVMFAPRCYVLDIDHAYSNKEIPISKQGYKTSPVKIGDGVWLGTQVVVTRGVVIGEGAIVAANSVVTKDIPPYTIAAGIPAKVIKKR
jgi:acetyltransferase-like isoleucine patch superfamily enzyme